MSLGACLDDSTRDRFSFDKARYSPGNSRKVPFHCLATEHRAVSLGMNHRGCLVSATFAKNVHLTFRALHMTQARADLTGLISAKAGVEKLKAVPGIRSIEQLSE